LFASPFHESVSWPARKGQPLSRDEVEDINRILARLGYKILGRHDADFLACLERRRKEAKGRKSKDPAQPGRLKAELVTVSGLAPIPRGVALDKGYAWRSKRGHGRHRSFKDVAGQGLRQCPASGSILVRSALLVPVANGRAPRGGRAAPPGAAARAKRGRVPVYPPGQAGGEESRAVAMAAGRS
jgi:hypothetical protein